jgi:hypothetical protein
MRRSYILIAVCASLLSLATPASSQAPERYKVRLATVPMDGGMRATIAGSGSASATLAGTMLSITGTFDGLKSPATMAKLNAGVARGVRGSTIANLDVTKSVKGSSTGSVDLTAEQVRGLRDGKLYIELASEKAPEGNLWGWLLR